jgi:chromate transporter
VSDSASPLSSSALVQVAPQFLLLSVLAVGGVNAVTPEIQRQVVELRHWMSAREFAELFAVAQATPGPNMLIATVVGWRVAGVLGAIVATACMCGPSSLIVYFVTRAWDRLRDRPWRRILQAGMAPVVVGLIGASGWILAKGASTGWKTAVLSAGGALLVWRTRLNPLWALGVAAALGVAGVV